jgi:MoxR-like ATPase
MQKVLNSVTDFRVKIEVPEAKRVFRLREGAKLWVTGSMNTTVYAGVYALNEDLKSRFRMLALDYPEAKVEFAILKAQNIDGANDALLKNLCKLAHETRQKALEYPLSTRDLIQIAEDVPILGTGQALTIALGKFEGDDRGTMKKRIQSVFGNVGV